MHTIRQLLRIGDEAYVKASSGGGARQRIGIRAGVAAAAAASSSVAPGANPLRDFDVGEVTARELRGSSVGAAVGEGGKHSASGSENSKRMWDHFKTSDLRTLAQHRAENVFQPITTDKGLGKKHYTNVVATHYLRALRGSAVVGDASQERKHVGAAVAKRQFLRIADELEDTLRHMASMVRGNRAAEATGTLRRSFSRRVQPTADSTAAKYAVGDDEEGDEGDDSPVIKQKHVPVPDPRWTRVEPASLAAAAPSR